MRIRARDLIPPALPSLLIGLAVSIAASVYSVPGPLAIIVLTVGPIALFAYWQYVGAAEGTRGSSVRRASWTGARLGAVTGVAMSISPERLGVAEANTAPGLFWEPGWFFLTVGMLAAFGAVTVAYRASRGHANAVNRSLAGAAEIDGPHAEPPLVIRVRDHELVIEEPVWCRMVALVFTCVGAALVGSFAALGSAPLAARGAMIAAGLVTVLTALDYVGTSLRRCQSHLLGTGPLLGMVGFGVVVLTARLVGLEWTGWVPDFDRLDPWEATGMLMVALMTQIDISKSPFEPPMKAEPEERSMLYIEFREAGIVETRALDENTLLDLDAEGNICAITIEHASPRTGVPKFSYEQVAA